MTAQWPQYLVKSFTAANQPVHASDPSVFYGPYTRLLYYLFGLDGDFEIQPQVHSGEGKDPIGAVATFIVKHNDHPVMFIQVKERGGFSDASKRREADNQVRDGFRAFRDNRLRTSLVTPRIPAISAFGTRLAFYEYVVENNSVTPAIPAINDKAPVDRWSCDVLEPSGIDRLRQETQNVVEMCQALD